MRKYIKHLKILFKRKFLASTGTGSFLLLLSPSSHAFVDIATIGTAFGTLWDSAVAAIGGNVETVMLGMLGLALAFLGWRILMGLAGGR